MELGCSSDHHTHISFMDRAGGSFFSRAEHICSRHCRFAHVVGNMFVCQSSGCTHVCDSNCNQRVVCDPHTAICRLSKRVFPIEARCAPAERKRCASEETTPLAMETAKVRRVTWD